MKNFRFENTLLVFDFDGVFTDNHVYVDEHGREMVRCSRADSLGIAFLHEKNIPMLILSTEENPVVSARAAKMKIDAIQGCKDKAAFLQHYALDHMINLSSVLYVGNDINDLPIMRLVGFPVCPSDAHPEIKKIACLVLSHPGGSGAVRELCDILLELYDKTRSKL
jgi:YrbI family 3-deoxy-D-manno-octulosonate 8-phosphate phosphatase